jgi:hypothetical protein
VSEFFFCDLVPGRNGPEFFFRDLVTERNGPEFFLRDLVTERNGPGFFSRDLVTERNGPGFFSRDLVTERNGPGFFLHDLAPERNGSGFFFRDIVSEGNVPGSCLVQSEKMDSGPFGDDGETQAGWQIPILGHFDAKGARCVYEYDFGDGWTHEVKLESIEPRKAKMKYPRCIAGERACPPEDCGGVPGYIRILDLLARSENDDDDEETEGLMDWLGDDFEPEAFDPTKVKFRSAATRLKALRALRPCSPLP